jgi:hypothetical protein
MVTPPTPQPAKPEKKGPLQEQTIPTPNKGRKPSRTMTALTTEEFITWANRLANLPWPMTLEEFTTTATKDFGWSTTEGKQRFAATFSKRSEYVLMGKNSDGRINDSFFPLGRAGSKEHVNKTLLNDLFVGYVAAGSNAWGEPFKTEHGKEPLMTWNHPTGCILQIVRTTSLVLFTFYTPQGAQYYE